MADLPLPQPENKDIYNYGFSPSLNRAIVDNSTGVVYDPIADSLNAGQVLSGGNLTLKTLSVGGLVKQVAPGDDIQAAIDAVNREGGGTVQLLEGVYLLSSNLELKALVSIVGAGRDITVLDFQSKAFGFYIVGPTTTAADISFTNMAMRGLTIRDSNAAFGLDIDYADFFQLENIRITSCSQGGLRLRRSSRYTLSNILSDANTGVGYDISVPSGGRTMRYFSVTNAIADSNGGNGFDIDSSGNGIRYGCFLSCTAIDNVGDGFELTGTTSMTGVTFLSCVSTSNDVIGFDIGTIDSSFVGCSATSNGSDGFAVLDGNGTKIISCQTGPNTGKNVNITATDTVLIGNDFYRDAANGPNVTIATGGVVHAEGNIFGSTRSEARMRAMKNNSGGTIRDGAVVVFASVAAGDNITTTTTNGDNKVFGVSTEGITNGNYGLILTEGYTPNTSTGVMVSNGTASISVGDYLSAYSHAYYAKKAVAGDMVFGIALSTPTTSTAVVSVLVISPRLI